MTKLTGYNIGICLVVCIGGFTYGFGFASFVTSMGQPGFYQYFKLEPGTAYTASIIGAVNALFYFGAAVGALLQGYTADWLGRRWALAVAAGWSLVGGSLAAGAANIPMLITVRIIHGVGLGMIICLVPVYLTEVSPAQWRGFIAGLTTLSFSMGYVICSWIAVGTYFSKNLTLQWRLPLALAVVPPLVVLFCAPFLPETPRFLVFRGKLDEAWALIQRIHHDPTDPQQAAARAEYTQIVKQVEHEKEVNTGLIQIFKKPSWRKRALLVMGVQFASHCTGVNGIAAYLPMLMSSLGVSGVMPLVLYGLYVTIGTSLVAVVICVVDRVGRRRLILIGYPLLALVLLTEALLQWKYLHSDNKGGLAACILFIFIHIVIYQAVDAPTFVWCAEVFPTVIRAKGISLSFFGYFVGAITFTTPSGVAFKNIGYRMYLLYMALCLIAFVVFYFYIPETKQVPMEELGALFGDEVVAHLTADGRGIVEDLDDSKKDLTSHLDTKEADHAISTTHEEKL